MMNTWHRDWIGSYNLVDETNRIIGEVCKIGYSDKANAWHEGILLGKYIDVRSAQAAVEKSVREGLSNNQEFCCHYSV